MQRRLAIEEHRVAVEQVPLDDVAWCYLVQGIGALPELAFTKETFADRRLLSFEAGEVRGLELLPGPTSDRVRQSVRLDLGVWRLDAPLHDDTAAALTAVLRIVLRVCARLRHVRTRPRRFDRRFFFLFNNNAQSAADNDIVVRGTVLATLLARYFGLAPH